MLNFLYTIIIYPLTQVIEFAFMLFDSVFKNEGISVIGVSIAVSVGTLPLYIVAEHWQQVQRDIEKKLDPGIQRIKSAFKGDEQYMILSTFYKQNHYHPLMALRSSFGLLIQIPFFIAAYSFLSNLPALQGESFLFVKDMGKQDALFSIGSFPINVLPIAMTAINWIAGAIYTKGFKLKDKVSIYGMALVFLVILYNSPSGLVIYWTMNNVFSLIKNIFYKIKNPLKVLYIILVAFIIFLDAYLLFVHNGFMHKRLLLAIVFTLLLFIPFVLKLISYLLKTAYEPLMTDSKLRVTFFYVSSIALAFLAGFVIPSFVINSSVVEFSDIDGYGSPLYFLYNSTLQMLGLLVFWPSCVYFLFHQRVQTLITVFFPAVLFASLIDAFCFSGDYGNLSRLITFDAPITSSSLYLTILNLVVVVIALALPTILLKFKQVKILNALTTIILIAELAITLVHTVQIGSSYSSYKKNIAEDVKEAESVSPVYHLTKTGKNVFVFMLDRAENAYIERIMDTYPEIKDMYKGFTLYRNTISYNGHTLLGAPGLFGGYEYTPVEINKRSNQKLVDKQNEALLLMPRVFTEQADFKATVTDLSWANYSWIPDMSICKPYPSITGFNVERKYSSLWVKENPDKIKPNITSNALKRNLVWFSLFKFVPLCARDSVYDDGGWWSSDVSTSDIMEFIDYYSVLDFLPRLTDFTATEDSFFSIVNDTTHSGQDLQAPLFEPALKVTDDGPDGIKNVRSIDGNIAALRKLGEWIQYLKENDCFDNTRIILVSDHGIGTDQGKEISFGDEEWPFSYNPDHLNPLLMVKDFNSDFDFTIDQSTFMTNADVPVIAFKDIIQNPVNPFTGKEIKEIEPSKKIAVGVTSSNNWRPGANGLYTFRVPENEWFTVRENIFDANNWQKGISEE